MLYNLNLDCLPSAGLLPAAANYRLLVGEHAIVEAGTSPNLMFLVELSENL